MAISDSRKSLKFSAPPRRLSKAGLSATSQEPVDAAVSPAPDRSLKVALGAVTSLAVTLGPQAAAAAQTVIEQPLTVEMEKPKKTTTERVESLIETLEDQGEKLEGFMDKMGSFVPDQLTHQYQHDLGGWDFKFQGMDVDIKPKIKGDVGLRLYGDFLETSLSQGKQLNEDWSTSHGFRAVLRGEVNTYDHPELDLNLQAYKHWSGTIGKDFDTNLDIGFGFRNRLHGEEWEKGMGAGVSLRQEIEGGNLELFNRDFRLYLDARQGVYRNLETGNTSASYSLMVGPKHDIDFEVFGQEARVTLTAGPEIKGRFNDYRDEPFDLGFKFKLKTKF